MSTGTHVLAGLIPSLCTPFDADGEVDLDGLARLSQFAERAGADGVACMGLAGEVGELDRDERARCVTAAVEALSGRLPVVVGVGARDAPEAARLAADAEHRGASAIMLPVPGIRHSSLAERTEALVSIAGTVTVPVMVQDAPAYLGTELGIEAVGHALQQAPNIRHLKLEGGSRVIEIAESALGGEISLWGGDGGRHLLDCLRIGAVGVIPGVEMIDLLVAVREAEARGDCRTAEQQFAAVLPWLVFAMETLPGYVACAKAALLRRGLISQPVARLPGALLKPGAASLMARHLDALGPHPRADGVHSD